MTDSMNFGPEWLRNLSSEGSTGGGGSGVRYQLAEYRYGREEMLALYEKGSRPPASLTQNPCPIYSEQALPPLALMPATEEERSWQPRVPLNPSTRGRGGSLERGGGRVARGRGSGPYQPSYGSRVAGYEGGGGWGNSVGPSSGPTGTAAAEQSEWSPRKEYGQSRSVVDNWRRNRGNGEEDDGWRSSGQIKGPSEKWGRSMSWRDGDVGEERRNWHDGPRGPPPRRSWDEEGLPEWATENLAEGGGTFDSAGAFHGSDDEQLENKSKRDMPLQKSASHQNITMTHSTGLVSSKSTTSLVRGGAGGNSSEQIEEEKQPIEKVEDNKEVLEEKNRTGEEVRNKKEVPEKGLKGNAAANGHVSEPGGSNSSNSNRVEEDFDKLQEDLVLKLVVDEETPKYNKLNFDMGNVQTPTQPPPNLAPPPEEKWYYQDPQGDTQGPFPPSEMAEWFGAGYFNTSLMVKRECDARFCMLGELVTLCAGNPFLSNVRIAPLKVEPPPQPKVHDTAADAAALQYQLLLQNQLALRNATVWALSQSEPWGGLSAMQQRDLVTQHMLSSQPHMPPDLAFLQQQQAHPFMHMVNQIQANKMPGPGGLPDKPPNPTLPPAAAPPLDPIQALVQQMQQRMPNAAVAPPLHHQPGHIQVPASLPPSDLPGLPMHLGVLPPRPAPLGAVDPLSSASAAENDPIKNLLRQLQSQKQQQQQHVQQQQQQQQQQLESLWQQTQPAMPPQWQQEMQMPPMWAQPSPPAPLSTEMPPSQQQQQQQQQQVQIQHLQQPHYQQEQQPQPQQPQQKPSKQPEKETKTKEEQQQSAKELKKKKELEEKQAKKEQEEKKKQEIKKQEMEKKAAEEKKKKEDEKARKEQEKAKREAEEKRLRELEEKRKLKEQRKAAEEARKKTEEHRKQEEAEKSKLMTDTREEQVKRQSEQPRQQTPQQQQQQNVPVSKVAPWCQSNTTSGTSLEEIQKAERQKRAEQAALLQQQKVLQQQQQQQALLLQQQQELQQNSDKPGQIQLKWASKPIENRKVKSLAEIQAEEEHERLAKQQAEARLKEQKEKESAPAPVAAGIWSGQNLSWATSGTSQWSANASGFWDEATSQKSVQNKPSMLSKSVSSSAVVGKQQQQKPSSKSSKAKREEQQVMKVFNNGPAHDEFTEWCIKALADINSSVDVPTFVTFLRDIESGMDVREYCKEYLGEGPAMQQFASDFLEKRRFYKQRSSQHKDDMCVAPTITASSQHSNEFQEVKGKSKKAKKSKMMKVDSRILGFNVTAAQDRINVGDLERIDL